MKAALLAAAVIDAASAVPPAKADAAADYTGVAAGFLTLPHQSPDLGALTGECLEPSLLLPDAPADPAPARAMQDQFCRKDSPPGRTIVAGADRQCPMRQQLAQTMLQPVDILQPPPGTLVMLQGGVARLFLRCLAG